MFFVWTGSVLCFIRINFAHQAFLDTFWCLPYFTRQFMCPQQKIFGHPWFSISGITRFAGLIWRLTTTLLYRLWLLSRHKIRRQLTRIYGRRNWNMELTEMKKNWKYWKKILRQAQFWSDYVEKLKLSSKMGVQNFEWRNFFLFGPIYWGDFIYGHLECTLQCSE